VRKDGRIVWTEHKATHIKDESGRLVAIEGIARDVTGRKNMEIELERERERLRFLSDASASMARSLDFEATLYAVAHAALPVFADYCFVDLLDERGQFQRIVAAAADPEKDAELRANTEREAPQLGGPHPMAVAVATQKPVVLSSIPESVFEGIIPDDETRRSMRARFPVGSAIAVPLNARGRCLGALMLSAVEPDRLGLGDLPVIEELGRRASQFLDNARLYGEAQRALATRDEVLGWVAHDLRNPLNAVGLRAQQLLKLRMDAPGPELARSIRQDVKRMNALIQDLLDVVRNEAGVLNLQRTLEAPERIVDDAREMLQPLADAASIELKVNAEPDLPSIRVDRTRILQVVSNLAGNALKFAPAGSALRLEVTRGEGEVCFCVSDQGPGIPAEQLGHVFDRFWQGGGTERRGLGLGLSITRTLVEMQGGRVWVESEIGAGTRVHFAIRS
jgi:signal transduction histidine kinase